MHRRREIDTSPHITPAIYLTAEIPGIGGTLKACPEDFLVEELPLYAPCGEGEHIYLFVEKRGMNAMEMHGLIARVRDCKPTMGRPSRGVWIKT